MHTEINKMAAALQTTLSNALNAFSRTKTLGFLFYSNFIEACS